MCEALASDAGLTVARSVTKALNVLVVADPDTMSGKAEKARRYGTRIIAEPVFWRLLGIAVD
jgi:DNA polymerase-3 subunit epsilon